MMRPRKILWLSVCGVVLASLLFPSQLQATALQAALQTTPTLTATATATPQPVACNADEHEVNDGGWGCVLIPGLPLTATLTTDDVDWFLFSAKAGWVYRLEAAPLTAGVDPSISVVELPGYVLLAHNDDAAVGDPTARLDYTAGQTAYYAIVITGTGIVTGTYRVLVSELAATPTPTATPTGTNPPPPPTSTAGPTQSPYEPNNTWDVAKALALGLTVADQINNGDPLDWWALRVKPGVTYTCRASSANFDPKLRVEQDGQVVAANDDAVPGKTDAVVQWSVAYDAIAYPVVESTFGAGDYQLTCTVAPPTATPTARATSASGGGGNSGALVPTAAATTPVPPITPATPTPRVTIPAFTPAPAGTPGSGLSDQAAWLALGPAYQTTPVVTTLHISVFYDFNANKAPEPDEGIEGLSVRALYNGHFVASGLTNAQGEANLVVVGPVDRVLIPFLRREKKIKAGAPTTFQVAVQTVKLPTFLPVTPPEEP